MGQPACCSCLCFSSSRSKIHLKMLRFIAPADQMLPRHHLVSTPRTNPQHLSRFGPLVWYNTGWWVPTSPQRQTVEYLIAICWLCGQSRHEVHPFSVPFCGEILSELVTAGKAGQRSCPANENESTVFVSQSVRHYAARIATNKRGREDDRIV